MTSIRSLLSDPRTRAVGVAVVAAGILLASVVDPGSAGEVTRALGPLGVFGLDKWVHAAAYGTLAAVTTYALAARTDVRRPSTLLAVVAVVVAYGVGIELVQSAVPARSFDVTDMAANGTGALVAVVAWVLVGRRVSVVPLRPATDD
ncbi:VanZ family protein [Halomarina oriensis]|uniref:Antibiotic resistance protein VanZ n=1 Tax=Halomarina oriensis TaxID=671145 RepID=A0A6B0GN12_9EURY|nr:VanZ family protein [Halomarina oriensis]MWG34093.1 antibiotic resistance protein VanZ [Halomarina oriensis]